MRTPAPRASLIASLGAISKSVAIIASARALSQSSRTGVSSRRSGIGSAAVKSASIRTKYRARAASRHIQGWQVGPDRAAFRNARAPFALRYSEAASRRDPTWQRYALSGFDQTRIAIDQEGVALSSGKTQSTYKARATRVLAIVEGERAPVAAHALLDGLAAPAPAAICQIGMNPLSCCGKTRLAPSRSLPATHSGPAPRRRTRRLR